MSVPATPFPSVHARARSRATRRIGITVALTAAVVAGLLSGAAPAAADTGDFTPIDFSQAPPPPQPIGTPITTGLTLSGSITVDGNLMVTPPDILADTPVTTISFANRPPLGGAHLFSRTSGYATMSDAQYAGMVAMEDDAVRSVMSAHGIANNANNHDLVIEYAREDTVVALYARLQQALSKDTRSLDEQQALNWVAAVAQNHAVGAAQAAKNQFDQWRRSPCAFHPPAPYTDYDISDTPRCQGLRIPGSIPVQERPPTKEQFVAWGAASYDATSSGGRTAAQQIFTASASEAAIAFGAAGAFFGVGAAAGITANLISSGAYGAGPLTAALYGFVNTGVKISTELASKIGIDAATAIATQAASGASRFVALLNITTVLGPVLIIAAAIVQAVLAGIDAFAARNLDSALSAAVDTARNSTPDLRDLLSTTAGQQQVFGDLAASVIDCTAVTAPGECGISASQPTRRVSDPVIRTTDIDSGEATAPTAASAPISLGRPGAFFDTSLAIRDGWFTFNDLAAPSQLFHYTDFQGKLRTAHLVRKNPGGYYFQSLLDPEEDGSVDGSGYGPTADCTSGNLFQPCFTSPTLAMRTSSGRNVYLSLADDRAPTAPIVTTDRAASVGTPITLKASLPPNTPADPDTGDSVSSAWSVEFDQPCVQSDPADYGWRCSSNGATPNGPHGGYVRGLPAGVDTIVWNTPGTYRVTRRATDSVGVSTRTSIDVVVAPAARSLFAACLKCDSTAGQQVQIAGRVSFGPHRDNERITVDWGDGTTTTGVPVQASPGNQFLSPDFWATIENSAQYQFQAVHTYASGAGNLARITVSDTDAGDGDPPPVVLTADAAPKADPTSYGNVVDDRLVDYAVPLRLPVFTDSTGARPAVTCTAPDSSGGTRVVTDYTPFLTGTTTTVTCTATASSGVTGTASFTVTTHQITATAVASTDPVDVGEPVTYRVTGRTDDGRDVGDISTRVTMQGYADGVTCEGLTCSRTSTAGPIVAVPMADDNRVGPPVTTAVQAGLPAGIRVVDAGSRTLPVGTTATAPWSFVVEDAYGNPVPDVPVTLAVTAGTGTLPGGDTSSQVRTSANGVVAFTPSVGATAGDVVFKATVNDDVVAQFTAHATAGGGLRGVSGNAQHVRVGQQPQPLTLQLYDGNPSPVPGATFSARVVSGPALFANGATTTSGTTDGSGGLSLALATPATAGTSVVAVTAGGDTRLQVLYVTPNSAPVAATDAYTLVAAGGGARPTAAVGVLANDIDPDGDALAATISVRPKHGSLVMGRNGSFTYAPYVGWIGTDRFTYVATDGILAAAPQTVTVTVTPGSADIAVGTALPASLTRGQSFDLKVGVFHNGPSVAKSVVVITTLPAGLTFGAVPTGVTLSEDKRTATYVISSVAVGAKPSMVLPVLVAKKAKPGDVVITSAAGTALLPDPSPLNNTIRTKVAVS